MRKISFRRCYAPRIFAEKNIRQSLRSRDLLFFHDLAVFYDIHGHGRIDIADNVKIDLYIRVDLDYIFFPFFDARNVSYHRNGTFKFVKMQKRIQFHSVSSADVIDDKSGLHAVNIHTFTPNSFIIRAILIYLPLCACLK